MELKNLQSDLEALRELYGLIRYGDVTSNVILGERSKLLLKDLLDGATKRVLETHIKNSGSNVESIGLYFQAALKFLYSASLQESCNNEGTKHGEMVQSMQIYSSTAKLFEFCAHEYERLNKMAAASLAYKCTEVAYMRVIYTSHANASRDRHELQTALQMVPPAFGRC